MKKKIIKLSLFIALLFNLSHVSMAQFNGADKEQNNEQNTDTIGIFLKRTQTLNKYFSSSTLYIQNELQNQFDALITNTPLPKKNIINKEISSFLENYIASEALIAAKLDEINFVSNTAQISKKAFLRPHQVLTDWQLRSKHQELAKAYITNESFAGEENWRIFKPIYENTLAALETELRERGFFFKKANLSTVTKQLIDNRFVMVERFNQIARKEVMNFVDASPLMIENRVELAQIALKIDQIDEELGIELNKRPKYRELLTHETVLFRIETLEHGKRSAETKHAVMRHLDSDTQLLITKIKEQLFEEKSWFYKEKNSKSIGKSYSTRGPPLDVSTLSDFINEAKAALISKNKSKVFESTVKQWTEYYKALNLNSPRWINYKFHTNQAKPLNFNSLESFLQNHAKCYYERLSTSTVEAIRHKVIFETVAEVAFGKNNEPKMIDFINGGTTELIQYKYNLEQKIALHNQYAEPSDELELNEIKKHIEEISNRDQIQIKREFKIGVNRNRPPPNFEELILKIYDAEALSLKELAARYANISVPPSIEIRLKEIEKIRITNNAATIFQGYSQFTEESSIYKIMKYLYPESELVKEYDLNCHIWATTLDDIYYKTNLSNSEDMPLILYEKIKNAHSCMPTGKKSANLKILSRSPQDIEKYKSMTLRKNPGGIWLSPKGFQIKPKEKIDFDWKLLEVNSNCTTSATEWQIDSLGTQKICFSQNYPQPNTQHWLYQIKLW